MSTIQPGTPKIAFLLVPGMLATGTVLPYEMWLAANDFRRARERAASLCQPMLVGTAPSETAYGRLPIRAELELAACPEVDLIYIPALWRNPRATIQRISGRLSPWLRARYDRGEHIAAVSTGVSLLAESGLLNGRAATTHWFNFQQFSRNFPDVELKREFFITQSGSLYCAASINSLADITVHLIERFFDRATAQHVERNFSHEIRRTYAEYRYLDGGSTALHDEIVVEAQMWIAANLASRASNEDLAGRLGVSGRTLERRFRRAQGESIRNYWQRQRILLAKELLESTNLNVGDIAWRVGYTDAGYFARVFQRELNVSPFGYRQTVRAKLFTAPNKVDVTSLDTQASDKN